MKTLVEHLVSYINYHIIINFKFQKLRIGFAGIVYIALNKSEAFVLANVAEVDLFQVGRWRCLFAVKVWRFALCHFRGLVLYSVDILRTGNHYFTRFFWGDG